MQSDDGHRDLRALRLLPKDSQTCLLQSFRASPPPHRISQVPPRRYVNGIELPERKYVRHAKFMLTVINSDDPSKSVFKETEHRFYSREVDWGFGEMMRLGTIMDPTTGFLSREGSLHVRVDVKILRGPDYPGYDPRKETGCVGITNQGATCYLNSLLQTLYHIPAFRRAVYRIPTRRVIKTVHHIPALMRGFGLFAGNDEMLWCNSA